MQEEEDRVVEPPAPYPLDQKLERAYSSDLYRSLEKPWVDSAGQLIEETPETSSCQKPLLIEEPQTIIGVAPARSEDAPPESIEENLQYLPDWQAKFVIALMENGGNIGMATTECRVSKGSVEKARLKSAGFDEACRDAIEYSTDLIEGASVRRATIGVRTPIYQGGHLVGWKRMESPKDAEIMLKVRGRLKDEQKVTVNTTSLVSVVHRGEIGVRVREVAALLFGGKTVEAEVIEQEPKA